MDFFLKQRHFLINEKEQKISGGKMRSKRRIFGRSLASSSFLALLTPSNQSFNLMIHLLGNNGVPRSTHWVVEARAFVLAESLSAV